MATVQWEPCVFIVVVAGTPFARLMQKLSNHMDTSPLNCTNLLLLYLQKLKLTQVYLAMLQAHREGRREFIFSCIKNLVSWLRKQDSLSMVTNLWKPVFPLHPCSVLYQILCKTSFLFVVQKCLFSHEDVRGWNATKPKQSRKGQMWNCYASDKWQFCLNSSVLHYLWPITSVGWRCFPLFCQFSV